MSVETKVIGEQKLKFPIRILQYVEPPYRLVPPNPVIKEYGLAICDQTLPKLVVLVEAQPNRVGRFSFACPGQGLYSNVLTYSNYGYSYNVNVQFIDGHDSFLYVTETHYQDIESHLLSSDTVKADYYRSVPTLIEIARN